MNHSQDTRGGGFGSRPYDPLHPSEIPGQPEVEGCYGLAQRKVDELRDIIRRHSGIELTNQEAWHGAIELVAFTRMLAEMPDWPGEQARSSDPQPPNRPIPTQGALPL